MQKPNRIEIDLGFRYPRSFVLRLGGDVLVFKEPSLSYLDECGAFHLDNVYAKELIKYLQYDSLEEFLDLIDWLPVDLLKQLVHLCALVFECDETPLVEALNLIQEPIGRGELRKATSKYSASLNIKHNKESLDYLLERLGVLVKATPNYQRQEMEDTSRRTEAWIPLTAAINPESYRKIRNALSYDPETFDEEQNKNLSEHALIQRNKTVSKKDKEKLGADEKDKLTMAYSGDTGVSMTQLSKEAFAKLWHSDPAGFLKASKEGIDLTTYRKAGEQGVDPTILAERQKETPDQPTVTIKSRWRSKKEQ
jgi:hypothetical protein